MIRAVATKQRSFDMATARGRAIAAELGHELRNGRLSHGLSQACVAKAARTSRSQVSRVELGQAQRVSVVEWARLLAAVGLEIGARAFPGGQPVRDSGHLALLRRLRCCLPPTVAWRFEVPVGPGEDDRAWDALLLLGRDRVAIEAETRPNDVQALLRRVALKRRDDRQVQVVVLALADTRHNRGLLRDHGAVLRTEFPGTHHEVLEALKREIAPGRSGIVIL
jgi:transcriptional regulator with XRE-family HTH domain